MSFDYLILVVLYNRSVYESETLCSLVEQKDELVNSRIIVWDNSRKPIPSSERDYLTGNFVHVSYKHTAENLPLSKLYNQVIEQSQGSSFLILFDQDSSFDNRYFQSLRESRAEFPEINLFVPLILLGTKIMSPGYYFLFKGSYRKQVSPGKLSVKNMAIITSGMAVSVPYVRDHFVHFNEELTFYGLDTFFALKYRENNEFFYVLDCGFKHDLAQHSNEGYPDKVKRFRKYRESISILAKRSMFVYLLHFPYILYISLGFYIKNKLLR